MQPVYLQMLDVYKNDTQVAYMCLEMKYLEKE